MALYHDIQKWFPYESLRPHQDTMLNKVFDAVSNQKVLFVNAPTGSGKSSVVAAVLAATPTRPILVAVRTVSQLNIFVREMEMIRQKKQPGLKYCYILGKGKACQVFGEMGINQKCKAIKKKSKDKIERIGGGSRQSDFGEATFDAAAPAYCPWWVKSRVISDVSGMEMNSPLMSNKASEFSKTMVSTESVKAFAGDVCPYEMMKNAAYDSDVVILNYHHVLNCAIRSTLLGKMYAGENRPILILDEAHNAGNAVEELHSVQIDSRTIDNALEEIRDARVREQVPDILDGTVDKIPGFLEWMKDFITAHEAKYTSDNIFDYKKLYEEIHDRFGTDEGAFTSVGSILAGFEKYQKSVDEGNRGHENDVGCERLIKMLEFIGAFVDSSENSQTGSFGNDQSVVKIFQKRENGSALRLRSIDPSDDMKELKDLHESIIFMSGTLHPTESYAEYFFGGDCQEDIEEISLPNTFPTQNRRLMLCQDVTSAYAATSRNHGDNDNNRRIYEYVKEFVRLPGNLAIFFPSYYMLDTYSKKMMYDRDLSRDKRIYVEPRNAREAERALKQFMDLPLMGQSGIMLAVSGGKFSEGVDYRGDTLVGAMVIGLPLASWSPIQKWINAYYTSKFGEEGNFIAYTLPALNRAQQAIGRVIRNETDRGFLVFCEKRYLENMPALPEWMGEESIECDVEEFGGYVKRWTK